MGPFKWKILSTKCTQFLQKKQAAPSVPITYQRFRADNGDHYDIFTLCGRIRISWKLKLFCFYFLPAVVEY